jgi:hypothetical protein
MEEPLNPKCACTAQLVIKSLLILLFTSVFVLLAAAGFWLFGFKGLAGVAVMVLSTWLGVIWPISHVLSHKGARGAALVSFVALFVLASFGYWILGATGPCVGMVLVVYYWLQLLDVRNSENA